MSARNFSIASMSSYNIPQAGFAAAELAMRQAEFSLAIGKSGYRIYTRNENSQTVYQTNLTSPLDVTTKSGETSLFDSFGAGAYGVAISSTGHRLYVWDSIASLLRQYTLTNPWEITSAYRSSFYDVLQKSNSTSIRDFKFSLDGLTLYILDVFGGTNAIYQYTLGVAWEISTAVYSTKFLAVGIIGMEAITPYTMAISPLKTTLYVGGVTAVGGQSKLYEFDLSNSSDISTAVYAGNNLNVSAQCNAPVGLEFIPDGYGFILAGVITGFPTKLLQYNLK